MTQTATASIPLLQLCQTTPQSLQIALSLSLSLFAADSRLWLPTQAQSVATGSPYPSVRGQRDFPRPTRKASTSLVLPSNRPEKRLGLGSTAEILNGETRW